MLVPDRSRAGHAWFISVQSMHVSRFFGIEKRKERKKKDREQSNQLNCESAYWRGNEGAKYASEMNDENVHVIYKNGINMSRKQFKRSGDVTISVLSLASVRSSPLCRSDRKKNLREKRKRAWPLVERRGTTLRTVNPKGLGSRPLASRAAMGNALERLVDSFQWVMAARDERGLEPRLLCSHPPRHE